MLISVGILSIGLLGVAALIPVGKLAMIETEKSDRTGACGRAALQEVRIRGLCDPNLWNGVAGTPPVVIIDPLGWNNGLNSTKLGGSSGILNRYILTTATSSSAATQTLLVDSLCRWHDDLNFSRPDEVTAGTAPVGSRPVPAAFDTNGNPEYHGNFSWFLTIAPQYFTANGVTRYSGTFNVAVAVCYKRVLSTDGEKIATVSSTAHVPSIANGGGDVTLSGKWDVPNNQWVMLCKANGSAVAWYRVVNQLFDNTDTTLMLVGPDWSGASDDRVIIIDGVTGVYTTTVRAN
ncbi:MAG: hypothetical protein ABFC54_05295 [Thermoguttaceae bacterium]